MNRDKAGCTPKGTEGTEGTLPTLRIEKKREGKKRIQRAAENSVPRVPSVPLGVEPAIKGDTTKTRAVPSVPHFVAEDTDCGA